MSKVITSPHFVRNQLLRCPESYVESVGKEDMDTLSSVFDTCDGKGTVLRLIMGATVQMPVRALSYIDSAVRIARILPCEQVQIIHANHLGNAINNVSLHDAGQQARTLAEFTAKHIAVVAPEIAPKVLHGQDSVLDLDPFEIISRQVLTGQHEIGIKLQEKGRKHGGNALRYAAAHAAFQDTDRLKIMGLRANCPEQVTAERIVSIGCQQERLFYAVRMAMRPLLDPDSLVASAQIFTHHVTPPYFMARNGEQSLEHALEHGLDLGHPMDPSSRRDLEHMMRISSGVLS